MIKKLLLAAIIVIASAATIISISAPPNHLSVEHMTDEELKAKIDSLAHLEQPLTAAPFIAEAKKRASAAHDTKWMLDIIHKDISLNALRNSRTSSPSAELIKARDNAWTPLRQLLNLELRLQCSQDIPIDSIIDAPDVLFSIPASQAGAEGWMESRNILDYLTISIVSNDQSDVTDSTSFSPIPEFIVSNAKLPDNVRAIQTLMRTALAKADTTSLAIAQVLRISLTHDAKSIDRLISELEQLSTPSSPSATALADLARATRTLDMASALSILDSPERLVQANAMISDAEQLLSKAKELLSGSIFADFVEKTLKEINSSFLDISADRQVIPNAYTPVYLKYRNNTQVTLRVFDLKGIQKIEFPQNGNKDIAQKLSNFNVVESKTVTLPQTNIRTRESSAAIELKGLPLGHYAIAAFVGDSLVSSTCIVSSQIAVNRISPRDKDYLLVTDFKSGEPLSSASVVGQDKADANGWFRLNFNKNDRYQQFTVLNGKDSFSFETYGRRYYGDNDEASVTNVKILTDRNIYRLGQTIFFKVFVYDAFTNHLTPAKSGTSYTIKLNDAFGKAIASKTFTVDGNGAAHGTLDIPSDVMKGRAALTVKLRNGRRQLGWHDIRIEDFKRTDNTVSIDPFSEALLPGASVSVSGSAMSAAGLPVANATVRYSVTKNGGMFGSSSSDVVVSEGSSSTDSNGRFSFSFDSSKDGDLFYNVVARVTDLKGETSEDQRTCHISENGSEVDLSQESNIVEVNHPHLLTLSSTNSNGEPYAATLHLKLTPYNHTKPLRPFATSNVDTILSPDAHIVINNDFPSLATTPSAERDIDVCGTSTFDIAPLNLAPGKYIAAVSTKALNGSVIQSATTLTVIASSGASPNLDYISIVAPDEAQNGTSFSVKFCSGLANAVAHVFFVRRGVIEMRESIPVSCGVSSVDYNVPSDVIDSESLKIVAIITHDGRRYETSKEVILRHHEESITLNLSSFRDFSHPGAHEEWMLTSKGADAVVVSIYDSRLDKYVDSKWDGNFRRLHVTNSFDVNRLSPKTTEVPRVRSYDEGLSYNTLNNFTNTLLHSTLFPSYTTYQMNPYLRQNLRIMGSKPGSNLSRVFKSSSALYKSSDLECDEEVLDDCENATAVENKNIDNNATDNNTAPIREDFAETVCFFPDLKPFNDTVIFNFHLPDNLTTYNFRALAYDHDLRSTMLTHNIVVRKPLNVRTGIPRFLVEQDTILLSADVTASDTSITSAVVSFTLTDTTSGKAVLSLPDVIVSFANSTSQRAQWQLTVPVGIDALQIDVVATANGASDGERHVIPVERRFVNIDETHTFTIIGKGAHEVSNPFSSGDSKSLSFSYTSNAFIEVMRALPILDKSTTPCADTYIGRFESSAIALLLAKRPEIRRAVDYLRDNATSDDAPNRITDAEHTPWLYVANLLRQHDRDVVRVMSANRAEQVKSDAIAKLAKLQKSNGGFPWFDGMKESNWLTACIAQTIGNMIHLGIITADEPHVSQILKKALPFLNAQLNIERKDTTNFSSYTLTALHARLLIDPNLDNVTTPLVNHLADHWQNLCMSDRVKALAVLTLARRNADAQIILKSLEENLVQTNDGTAYLPATGFFIRREQVETQALLILALQRLNPQSPNLPKLVNHLILMKRGSSWLDVQCTSHAVLALLGSAESYESHDVISVNNASFDATSSKPEVSIQLPTGTRSATVTKSNDVISWGSWSRTIITPKDQMDADSTDKLKILRTIEVRRVVNGTQQWIPAEGQDLTVGDEIRVSMKFYNDEPLCFVRIRDFRAAALEPDDKLSGYRGWWWWRWSDANIPTPPHYFVIADSSMEFFIDYLEYGWHQLSYRLTVTANGDFSAGYADATCMYNTDICAHTNGCRLSFKL